VGVGLVIKREVGAKGTFPATVMPIRASTIGTAVDGRVSKYLFVSEDKALEQDFEPLPIPDTKITSVKKDTPLAQLRTRTIGLELAAAEALSKLREHELSELRAGARPEEIVQANARKLGAEALKKYTEDRYLRNKKLHSQNNTITEDALNLSLSDAIQARQAFTVAENALALLKAGPRKEKIAQAEAQLAFQEAEVDRLKQRIKKYTIRAPFDGYVVAEYTEIGAWVKQGDPIVDLIQLDHVELRVFVPERAVINLDKNAAARVTFASIPEDSFVGICRTNYFSSRFAVAYFSSHDSHEQSPCFQRFQHSQ